MSASTAEPTADPTPRTATRQGSPAAPQQGSQRFPQQSLPTRSRAPLPAPQDAGTSSARALIAHYRSRSALAFDVVGFAAPCPGCGGEAEWVQQREDTRVRTQVSCPVADCPP